MEYYGFERVETPYAPKKKIEIKIENAKEILEKAMGYYLALIDEKKEFAWQPEYDQVAEWLTDNQGKGLFLFGSCGRGKSLLTRHVLPGILAKHCRMEMRIYSPAQMNQAVDCILGEMDDSGNFEDGVRYIALDDIGCETELSIYGNKRIAFAEIIDAVERDRRLIIANSNLSRDEIIERYGSRVFDRLISTTRRIEFKGKSMR